MKRWIAALATAGLMAPAVVSAAPTVPERVAYLVRVVPGVGSQEAAALASRLGAQVTGTIPELSLQRWSVPVGAAATLTASPLLAAVERERTLHVMGGGRPNDPLLDLQWPLRKVDAFKAWKYEESKNKVVVGVIDTGVDQSHPDLQKRLVDGFDFVAHDTDPYDDNGHGTHVSGIIAANVSNRVGIAGLSRGAQILPLKACTADGACGLFEIYGALVDGVRLGAEVINMSLGGAGECSSIDQTVYDYVRQLGVLVVVAAGNSGQDKNPVITPASCNFTLAVGAVDKHSRKAPFSSFGDFVDIAAPGVEVWSTLPPLVSLLTEHIGYGAESGTSMASPFVAAAAASLKGLHPDWTPEQIEQRLLESAVDAGKKGRDDMFGEGILNLLAALR
ncbi:MAG: thermitase [Actinomycetota bacterium]|jgi:subtilisin family serine protease|nr:thermitase [Actinomycetota bacterium]